MSGSATLTMEPSSAFMNMARQTTTRAIQRRRSAPAPVADGGEVRDALGVRDSHDFVTIIEA